MIWKQYFITMIQQVFLNYTHFYEFEHSISVTQYMIDVNKLQLFNIFKLYLHFITDILIQSKIVLQINNYKNLYFIQSYSLYTLFYCKMTYCIVHNFSLCGGTRIWTRPLYVILLTLYDGAQYTFKLNNNRPIPTDRRSTDRDT